LRASGCRDLEQLIALAALPERKPNWPMSFSSA
jgi:hypothetical protein